MILSWLRNRKRRRVLERGFPVEWLPHLEQLPFYGKLTSEEQTRLRQIAHVIVEEKEWESGRGLQITDQMRVTIAAQAALLIVNREHEYYRNVESVVIHPDGYMNPNMKDHVGGPSHVLGEAWYRGPVVLSWDNVKSGAYNPYDGHNLVYHEFAHKLDMQDGIVDGTPILERGSNENWYQVMTREYEKLIRASESGKATVLDKYGATNPGEFFAVATESFFERSRKLLKKHPELYGALREFYQQDPAEWRSG